jgi:hypothetical protein
MPQNDKVSEAFVLREIAECEALAEGQKEFLRRLAAQCLVPSAERATNSAAGFRSRGSESISRSCGSCACVLRSVH